MTTIMTLSLALAMGGTGQCPNPAHRHHRHDGAFYRDFHGSGGFIEPDGPGNGWGFPNGAPTGTAGTTRALPSPGRQPNRPITTSGDTSPIPPEQAFMGIYYNPYVNRGQRYLPYTGNGGDHPMGGPPLASAITSQRPVQLLVQFHPRHPHSASSRPRRGPAGKLGQDRADSLTVPLRPSLHDRYASPCGRCPPHRFSHSG